MHCSRKYLYYPTEGIGISRRVGLQTSKKFKEHMKLNWNSQRRRGVLCFTPLCHIHKIPNITPILTPKTSLPNLRHFKGRGLVGMPPPPYLFFFYTKTEDNRTEAPRLFFSQKQEGSTFKSRPPTYLKIWIHFFVWVTG